MLWNSECCGTPNVVEHTTNVVEQRMLWNNERCGTTREKTYYELRGTTNVVEQRMLWNNECCGTTNDRSLNNPGLHKYVVRLFNFHCCETNNLQVCEFWNWQCRKQHLPLKSENVFDDKRC